MKLCLYPNQVGKRYRSWVRSKCEELPGSNPRTKSYQDPVKVGGGATWIQSIGRRSYLESVHWEKELPGPYLGGRRRYLDICSQSDLDSAQLNGGATEGSSKWEQLRSSWDLIKVRVADLPGSNPSERRSYLDPRPSARSYLDPTRMKGEAT